MKCSKVREILFEYIDGTLSKSELSAIEEHLQNCPDCQLELEQIKRIDARLKQEVPAYLESIEPSPAFLNRSMVSEYLSAMALPKGSKSSRLMR